MVSSSEAWPARILDEIFDSVVVVDDERRCIDANPAACALLGLRRGDLVGRRIDDVAPELAPFGTPEAWHEFLDRGYDTGVFPLPRAGGARAMIEYRARARVAPGAHVSILRDAAALGEIFDLDDAKLYTSAMRARAAAEEANRAKDQFLAVLGHELRNPLAPIATALRLMALGDAGAFVAERAIIERQVQHMTRLVDDLLDVSRIVRGKVELRRRSVEIAEIVAKAVEIASPALEERKHRLDVAVPSHGLTVYGDAARLAQVFANLLTNAAKYTAPGGRVSVRAARKDDTVGVSVSDTGVGIAPEVLPHIFDVFVQGSRGDAVRAGLGLGLAIVRSLAELHGGRVRATSRGLDSGSEFVVELPFLETTTYRTIRPTPREHPGVASQPRRILVVDDNADAAEMLAEWLVAIGHGVRVAGDGPTALEVAADFRPDVALLDIGLPIMDGYEVARRMRDLPGCSQTRLIALTGYGQESDYDRSRRAGFEEHLVKPVDLDAIQKVVSLV